MRDHAIFGGCLRSEIPLPELPLIEGVEPDWIFRLSTGSAPDATYLGDDRVDARHDPVPQQERQHQVRRPGMLTGMIAELLYQPRLLLVRSLQAPKTSDPSSSAAKKEPIIIPPRV